MQIIVGWKKGERREPEHKERSCNSRLRLFPLLRTIVLRSQPCPQQPVIIVLWAVSFAPSPATPPPPPPASSAHPTSTAAFCFFLFLSSISSSVFIVSWPTTLDEPWPKRTRAQSELVRLFAKHLSFDYNLTVNVTSHRVASPSRGMMELEGFLGSRAGKIKCSALLLIVKIILLFQPFCVCLWRVLSVFSLQIPLPSCTGSGCGRFCSRAAISEIYSPTIVYIQLCSTASFLFIMSELSLAHSYFISWKIKLRLVYGPQNTAKGWLTLKCLLCIRPTRLMPFRRCRQAHDNDEAQLWRRLWDIYHWAEFE